MASRSAEAQHLSGLARLRRVRDRIDREYAQPLDVEAPARGAHMSAGHLSRGFRLAYGESPYGYLMTWRIERAMALLRRGDLSVTEVCFAVGCSSLGTFSTRFTELVGVPPSAYRRQEARASRPPPVNNLKDVSIEIPKRRLTVFTGVSGSGKSSLVFGTIAAESQRLINETYSAFVQGFMPTLARRRGGTSPRAAIRARTPVAQQAEGCRGGR